MIPAASDSACPPQVHRQTPLQQIYQDLTAQIQRRSTLDIDGNTKQLNSQAKLSDLDPV